METAGHWQLSPVPSPQLPGSCADPQDLGVLPPCLSGMRRDGSPKPFPRADLCWWAPSGGEVQTPAGLLEPPMAPEGQGASADTPCLPELGPRPSPGTAPPQEHSPLGTAPRALSCWGLAGSWHTPSVPYLDPTQDCCAERPHVPAPALRRHPLPGELVCSVCLSAAAAIAGTATKSRDQQPRDALSCRASGPLQGTAWNGREGKMGRGGLEARTGPERVKSLLFPTVFT